MNRTSRIAPLILLCAGLASAVDASLVRQVNLEEMTARADRIFSGRVVEVRLDLDDERPVTTVTFEVDRVVKGDLEATVTLRMRGDRVADSPTRTLDRPAFRPGEEVVLFVYGDSRIGTTNPVGLYQGKFVVTEDKTGQRRAVNAHGNRGLLSNLSVEARERLELAPARVGERPRLTPSDLLDHAERLAQRGGRR